MSAQVTFVYPIIRDDFIENSLRTLLKYTDRSKYKVVVVDQTLSGIVWYPEDGFIDMVIRQKNQGFSNASNAGIIQALKWETPYIAIVNDDTEFMYAGWWEDLLEEFKTDERIIAVCPESPRVPLWGYGRPHDEYIDIVEYKENYSEEDIAFLKSGDYDKLVERYPLEPLEMPYQLADGKPDWQGKTYIPIDRRDVSPNKGKPVFPLTKRGVVDGIAMWLPVFKREGIIELGLLDEKFVWGGGEDYDYNTRAYSCAWPIPRDECDERYHKRMVSSMKSWVWHWWGKSKDVKAELDSRLFEGKSPWNNTDELWPPEINEGHHMDIWGHYTNEEGVRKPLKRIPEVYIEK